MEGGNLERHVPQRRCGSEASAVQTFPGLMMVPGQASVHLLLSSPMRTVLGITSLALLASLSTGCTLAKISGRGTTPMMLNNPNERVQLVEHFKTSKRIMFDYTGAFDVSEVLSGVMRGREGDAITNLTVTVKSDVGDFFINLFTLGIASSKTFQIEGDLVRYVAANGNSHASDIRINGEVLAQAAFGEPLMANLSDFSGPPEESPVVLRIDGGLALVTVQR